MEADGVQVNKSGQLYCSSATNTPICWVLLLQLTHYVGAQVVPHLGPTFGIGKGRWASHLTGQPQTTARSHRSPLHACHFVAY
jgi:hypothetical protein